MLARETAPFVLLDDAREDAVPARLYRRPVRVVEARTVAEVLPALDMLRAARDAGLHAVGFLSYDAAAAFETVLGMPRASDSPLLWFGLFEGYEEIAAADQLAPTVPQRPSPGAQLGIEVVDTYSSGLRHPELSADGVHFPGAPRAHACPAPAPRQPAAHGIHRGVARQMLCRGSRPSVATY